VVDPRYHSEQVLGKLVFPWTRGWYTLSPFPVTRPDERRHENQARELVTEPFVVSDPTTFHVFQEMFLNRSAGRLESILAAYADDRTLGPVQIGA
jgi:hypothetical protein